MKNNFYHLFYITFVFINPLLNNVAYTKEPTGERVTLQLKWKHQFQFAGYYAAIEKGFYHDSGLDVVLKEGLPGVSNTDEIIAGRADYGIDMPNLLIERQKGKAVDSVAANLSEGYGRYHYRESKHFAYYSRGSFYETKTWLTKVKNRKYIQDEDYKKFVRIINTTCKMLNNYIKSIGPQEINK